MGLSNHMGLNIYNQMGSNNHMGLNNHASLYIHVVQIIMKIQPNNLCLMAEFCDIPTAASPSMPTIF